ncbi:MAG: sulfite exporter TauE/SafE family protein [Negativicutes bacterium]|nr:sulfite exporter TauE/SafE family protein [Negativicutes bacterium]
MLIELYIFFVLVLSSFLQTVTGFGYAIITAPLLALVLGAKETVMIVMLTGLIIRLFLIRATMGEGSFKAIALLITASVLGAIPGAYVMTLISGDGLKIFMGIVLLAATAAMWKNCTVAVKHHKFTEAIVGSISGFLATTTSINGPPVVLYYLNAKAEENKTVFRANLTRYFLLINIASILISYFAGTLIIGDLWLHTLASIPALYIGFVLGERYFHRIDGETFRKASLVMVFVSSLAIIASALLKHA